MQIEKKKIENVAPIVGHFQLPIQLEQLGWIGIALSHQRLRSTTRLSFRVSKSERDAL